MASDLESFEAFVRQQISTGDCNQSPEEALRTWRSKQKEGVSKQSPQSLFDRLSSKGFIGVVSGGPDDLSCNPEHMNGFGESS